MSDARSKREEKEVEEAEEEKLRGRVKEGKEEDAGVKKRRTGEVMIHGSKD